MSERHSWSLWTPNIIGAVAAMVVALCASQIASDTAETLLAANWPELVLSVSPSDGPSLASLAEQLVSPRSEQEDVDASARAAIAPIAGDLATRSLLSDPLGMKAVRVLGQAAEWRNDSRLAEQLMMLGGSRGLRDATIDYWLLRYFAAREDYARALDRVDALLRVFPELLAECLSDLVRNSRSVEGSPTAYRVAEFRPAVASKLSERLPQADERFVRFARASTRHEGWAEPPH